MQWRVPWVFCDDRQAVTAQMTRNRLTVAGWGVATILVPLGSSARCSLSIPSRFSTGNRRSDLRSRRMLRQACGLPSARLTRQNEETGQDGAAAASDNVFNRQFENHDHEPPLYPLKPRLALPSWSCARLFGRYRRICYDLLVWQPLLIAELISVNLSLTMAP